MGGAQAMTAPHRRKDDCDHRRASENGLRAKLPEFENKVTVVGIFNAVLLIAGLAGGLFLWLNETRTVAYGGKASVAILEQQTKESAEKVDRQLSKINDTLAAILVAMGRNMERADGFEHRLGKMENK